MTCTKSQRLCSSVSVGLGAAHRPCVHYSRHCRTLRSRPLVANAQHGSSDDSDDLQLQAVPSESSETQTMNMYAEESPRVMLQVAFSRRKAVTTLAQPVWSLSFHMGVHMNSFKNTKLQEKNIQNASHVRPVLLIAGAASICWSSYSSPNAAAEASQVKHIRRLCVGPCHPGGCPIREKRK